MFGSKTSTKPPRAYYAKIKIYRDVRGQYRWRLLGSNGKIIADCSEGYVTKYNCEQAVDRFRQLAIAAEVVESSEVL